MELEEHLKNFFGENGSGKSSILDYIINDFSFFVYKKDSKFYKQGTYFKNIKCIDEPDVFLYPKFSHFFTTIDDETKHYSIFSEERISLDLKPIDKDDKKTQNTINTFRLNDIYQNHKDIVLELLQKREIYSDSYIDDLLNQYEGTLFKNREDLLRLITCGYVNDEDLHKRPLSKLIKDISEELKLIWLD